MKVGQRHEPMQVSRITFYDLHRQTGGMNAKSWTWGDCPLTSCMCSLCSTCQDLSLPALTLEVWVPGTTHRGKHKSKNDLLWFPACLPLCCVCEICCSGICRALAEGKVAQSRCLQERRWQINVRLSRSRCRGGINTSTLIIAWCAQTLHGFTAVRC